MLNHLIAQNNAHLVLNAIVVAFLVASTIYNWKLIKDFKLKIIQAYQKSDCAQNTT